MAINVVELPYKYFPDFDEGRPVFNGKIYVGEVGTDPELPENQKDVFISEGSVFDQTAVQVAQPIATSGGGVPEFNGNPVAVFVDGDYSIKVLNRFDSQVYYSASVRSGEPLSLENGIGIFQDLSELAGTEGLSDGNIRSLSSWYPGFKVGGSLLKWNATRIRSDHDGINVFSPTVPFTDSQAGKVYRAGTGETNPSGQGVWERLGVDPSNLNAYIAGFKPQSLLDQADAINSLMNAYGDSPKVITVPFVGTIMIDTESILYTRATKIDWGGNTLKLEDQASKYIFSQADLTSNFLGTTVSGVPGAQLGGIIEAFNFTMDGNATGGQTRDYTGSDARFNYPGFMMLFFGLDELVLHDFKTVDPEAWAVSYFLCDKVECYNALWDHNPSREGLNGDGITGQGRRVHIHDCAGYTADDFCAIITKFATVQGNVVWSHPDNNDYFLCENFNPTLKGGKYPFYLAGVYPADGGICKNWIMRDMHGPAQQGIWRCGNYFTAQTSVPGLIENIEETNCNSKSSIANQGQRQLFEAEIRHLSISDAYNIDTNPLAVNNQFIRATSNSQVVSLFIDDSVYQSGATPSTRSGDIYIAADSEINNIHIVNYRHSLDTGQDGTKFSLIENLSSTVPKLALSNIAKNEEGLPDQMLLKEDYWLSGVGIEAVDLNVSFSEEVIINSGEYTEQFPCKATYENGVVIYEGLLLTDPATVTTPSLLGAFSKPDWANPAADISASLLYVKNAGAASPQAANAVFRSGAVSIDLFHISGNPTDSYVNFAGVSYQAKTRLP